MPTRRRWIARVEDVYNVRCGFEGATLSDERSAAAVCVIIPKFRHNGSAAKQVSYFWPKRAVFNVLLRTVLFIFRIVTWLKLFNRTALVIRRFFSKTNIEKSITIIIVSDCELCHVTKKKKKKENKHWHILKKKIKYSSCTWKRTRITRK